jgi:glycerophosphoryl diester phosphodiesterase
MKDSIKRHRLLPGLERREPPAVMAHRGSMAREPENTLRSFRQALAEGADLLETDIRFTADGVPVCVHDASIDRTTDRSGIVAQMTLDELMRPRALDGRGGPTDEHIPTLEAFLSIIPPGRGVALEIKDDRIAEAGFAARVVGLIGAAGLEDRAVILSFERQHLQVMRREAAWLPTGLITMGNYSPCQPYELLGPHPKILYLNRLYIWLAHRLGKSVCPLDPWPDGRLAWYLRMGVDALLSNDPAATIAALEEARSGRERPT